MNTIFITRSNILKNLLIKNNCIEKKEGQVDFSYDNNNNNKIKSNIAVIPKKISIMFDNKKTLYTESKKNKTHIYQPNTITNLTNINLDKNKIYYLKNIFSSGGKNIYLIKNKEDLKRKNIKNLNYWIVQEEIENLLLYNNKKVTYRIYVVVTENKEFYLYKEGLGIVHPIKFDKNSTNYEMKVTHKNSDYIKLSDNENYEKIIKQIRDICYLTLRPFFIKEKFNNNYLILGLDFLINKKLEPILIEINAFPNLSKQKNKINLSIKTSMLGDFLSLYLYPKLYNIKKNTKNWILCNPLYHTQPGQKQLTINLENNLFKNGDNYNSIYKKLLCLRYWQTDCNCYSLNLEGSIRYMNKQFLSIFGTKLKLAKLLQEFNMLKNHPKTYFNLKELEDKSEKQEYFLKYAYNDVQTGIFYGNYNFIKEVINSIKKNGYTMINNIKQYIKNKYYVIQKSVNNPLTFKGHRITFGMWFVLAKDFYYIYDKSTELAVENNKKDHRIELHYNVIKDKNIKDHKIILKNILNVGKDFLDKLLVKMKDYDIKSNEISLCRMDIMVDKNYKPFILEINNVSIDLRGRESLKDFNYCKYLVEHILIKLLYKVK